MTGRVIKTHGGYYFVKSNGRIIRCYARGKLRLQVHRLVAGDLVNFTIVDEEENEGVVEEVLPRKNQLIRPPVANIDQVLIVFAFTQPEPVPILIDRMLVVIGAAGLKTALCFNKSDLVTKEEAQRLTSIYKNTGYPIILTSAKTGKGHEDIMNFLEGKVSIFSGPSGVGKSALLNFINPEFDLEIGELSSKISRGKHTTRLVQFLPVGNEGLVADTPGFTSLSLQGISLEELGNLFPEIARLSGKCRFADCSHRSEPGCVVHEALQTNEIQESRYESYLKFYEEIQMTDEDYKR